MESDVRSKPLALKSQMGTDPQALGSGLISAAYSLWLELIWVHRASMRPPTLLKHHANTNWRAASAFPTYIYTIFLAFIEIPHCVFSWWIVSPNPSLSHFQENRKRLEASRMYPYLFRPNPSPLISSSQIDFLWADRRGGRCWTDQPPPNPDWRAGYTPDQSGKGKKLGGHVGD